MKIETKRQGRIAHHHTDATVPHIVALLGFSFHAAKIGISERNTKFILIFPNECIFDEVKNMKIFFNLQIFFMFSLFYSKYICYLCIL